MTQLHGDSQVQRRFVQGVLGHTLGEELGILQALTTFTILFSHWVDQKHVQMN